jgi:hypothetical protein
MEAQNLPQAPTRLGEDPHFIYPPTASLSHRGGGNNSDFYEIIRIHPEKSFIFIMPHPKGLSIDIFLLPPPG